MVTIGAPNMPRPVAFHRYLTDQSGAPLGVIRMTGEVCAVCSPANRGKLGIVFDSPDGRSEQVQCLSCDYTLTRPKKDPPTRRMNQGGG